MKQKFYNIEKIESSIYFYTRKNEVFIFNSHKEFLSNLNINIIYRIGKSFKCDSLDKYIDNKELKNKTYYTWEYSTSYIVEKDGIILDPKNIEEDFYKYNLDKRKKKKYIKNFIYRKSPVPYTGKRSLYKNYFRYIRTTQEKRWSFLGENEIYPVKLRKRRNFKNIPNSWDDIIKERHKNWKKFRKTQYKINWEIFLICKNKK